MSSRRRRSCARSGLTTTSRSAARSFGGAGIRTRQHGRGQRLCSAHHGALLAAIVRPARGSGVSQSTPGDAGQRRDDDRVLAVQQPVQTVMSGPAAGAIAAARIGKQAGFPNLIACDMGGTSFDVSLVQGARPRSAEKDISYGVPVRVPMVDIHTIGAGGGSIAFVDRPASCAWGRKARERPPGPSAMGAAASAPRSPTPTPFLAGSTRPFSRRRGRRRAREGAARHRRACRGPLALDTDDAAAAILAVASNQLASAIRLVSIEKGHDPPRLCALPLRRRRHCALSSSRASSASRKSSCRAFPASPRR